MNHRQMFRAKSQEFEALVERTRGALKHNAQKGNVLETKFREFLAGLLPDRLGVTEGVIYSSLGQMSRQCDVIVFDKHRAPVVFDEASTRVIPVECVFAVIEVKTALSAFELTSFCEGLEQLRSFERSAYRPAGTPEKRFMLSIPPTEHFPILGYLFAVESSATLAHLQHTLAASLSANQMLRLPNAVFVGGRGSLAYHGPSPPLFNSSGWISYPNASSKVARHEGPDAFLMFLVLMLDLLLVAEMYREFDFLRYFRDERFEAQF